MKKKNIITLIMGIAICAILLTACGSKKETTAGTAEESDQSTEETSEPEKEKISLTTKNNLAGIASWQKGMETDDVWAMIKQELK